METTEQVIGTTAGQIWEYLDKKGGATLAKMSKDLDLDTNFAYLGIGWLAREGKINVEKRGNSTKLNLV